MHIQANAHTTIRNKTNNNIKHSHTQETSTTTFKHNKRKQEEQT